MLPIERDEYTPPFRNQFVMTTWDPESESALYEFAEEGDAPRRAWKRSSFPDRAGGEFAAEHAKEDTPILWVVPGHQGVSWWRWIGVAAGLAACADAPLPTGQF